MKFPAKPREVMTDKHGVTAVFSVPGVTLDHGTYLHEQLRQLREDGVLKNEYTAVVSSLMPDEVWIIGSAAISKSCFTRELRILSGMWQTIDDAEVHASVAMRKTKLEEKMRDVLAVPVHMPGICGDHSA